MPTRTRRSTRTFAGLGASLALCVAAAAASADDAATPSGVAAALRAAAAVEPSPRIRRRCESAAARLERVDVALLDRAPAWFRREASLRSLDAARARAAGALDGAAAALLVPDVAGAAADAARAARALGAARRIALAAVRRESRGPPRWTTVLSGRAGSLLSVWVGSGPAPEACVVGAHDADGPQVLRLRGPEWERVPVEGANDLWWVDAVPGDGFWACGTEGRVLRIDPETGEVSDRSAPTDATLYGIWGASPGEVWTVGVASADGPALFRWDGDGWEPAAVPEEVLGRGLLKVWGPAADEVWACGTGGTLLRWDGQAWSLVPLPAVGGGEVGGDLLTVHGNGDEVIAVGRVFGSTLVSGRPGDIRERPVPALTSSLAGVFVPRRLDPWAVGYFGNVLRRRRGVWREVGGLPEAAGADLHAVRIDDGGGVWIAGGDLFRQEAGVVLRYAPGAPTSAVRADAK